MADIPVHLLSTTPSRYLGGIAPPFLTSAAVGGGWSASCPGHFNPRELPMVPTEWEAEWAPEPVLKLWR
jgi:hypothetical protein